MGSEKNVLSVRIYGAEYAIRGQTNPDEIKAVANYLDEKMREVDKSIRVDSSLKVAILASLNITYELFHEKSEKEALKTLLDEKIKQLNALIDKQL
ncbi:cell division protein ZapA [bacterium]|nr:cell division protein ZapA [bacterium]